MRNTDLLKSLLDSERQAKIIVQEAESRADKIVRNIAAAMQSELLEKRKKKIIELDKDLSDFGIKLEAEKQIELSGYEESLQKEPVFLEDAYKALREIISEL